MDRKSLKFHENRLEAYKRAKPPMYVSIEYETVIIEAMKARSQSPISVSENRAN
jgi:hypothetical protein